jgi:hypothetical protein
MHLEYPVTLVPMTNGTIMQSLRMSRKPLPAEGMKRKLFG